MHLYTLDIRTLTPGVELTHLGAVTDVKFSPDSAYLVATDSNRKAILYSTEDYKVRTTDDYKVQTSHDYKAYIRISKTCLGSLFFLLFLAS